MRVAALLLGLAVMLCYANALPAPFLSDDRLTILGNPTIRSLRPPWLPLRTPPDQAASGRPVFNLSLALDHALGGRDPWRYRATNVGIHALAAMTLFGVVRRTLVSPRLAASDGPRATGLAFLCALLWAVHPLHTQAVTYLTQRCESLMGLFVLLTLYCAARGWTSPHRAAWHGAAATSALLGAGTKEVAALAPGLVLLYDRAFWRPSLREALRASRPLYAGLLLAPAAAAFLLSTQGQGAQALEARSFDGLAYLRSEAPVILHYVRLVIWPDRLIFDYDWPIASWQEAAPAMLGVLGLLGATAWMLWRRPAVGFLGAWLFVILAPTSTILPLRFLAFEYRMYLPSISLIVLGVVGASRLEGRFFAWRSARRPEGAVRLLPALGIALAALVAFALGTATVRRNHDYRSEVALWRDTVEKRPLNARARTNLGRALIDAGQRDEARVHFEEAVRLAPEDATTRLNLGGVYDLLGRTPEARREYERALALQPDHAQAHNNLAHLLELEGSIALALEHYEAAVRLDPEFAGAHFNLGLALRDLGRDREAAAHLREALRLAPGFRRAREALERIGEPVPPAKGTPP